MVIDQRDHRKCATALASLGLAMLVFGCNVHPAPTSTGGVYFGAPVAETCERGVAIVTSDYKSTNIAIAKLDGTTLSGSFVSSGAVEPGLALALSGNVDVPQVAPQSGRLVLLDRFGTNVLTWMDLGRATAIAQLAVGTGFEANPHDYIEVDASRAFVSRYGSNATPGAQPFDEGGDLLIIDINDPTITGRIAMPEENAALLPRPNGMAWLKDVVVVTLGRWSSDYSLVGDGRFVGVTPADNAVAWAVDIQGLSNCGRLALSPSRALGAVACSSQYDKESKTFDPAKSDIVLYDVTASPPQEKRRLGVGQQLGAGIQLPVAFATEDTILALTYGGNSTAGDMAFAVSATTGQVVALAEASQRNVFGGIHCSPGCGDVCLLSDAERSVLRRWQVAEDGTFTALADVVVDTVVGLPPRSIGGL